MCLLVEGLNGLISPKTVRYTGRNCHIQKQGPRNPARLPADEEQDATAELEDHRQDGRQRRQRKVPFREITDRDPEADQFHVAQINEQKRHQDAASQENILGVITVIRAAVELWCIRVCAHNPPLRLSGIMRSVQDLPELHSTAWSLSGCSCFAPAFQRRLLSSRRAP